MSLLKRKTPSQKELDQLWSNLTFGTSHRNRQISDAVMASGFHLCDQRREVAVHAESEVQFQLHQRLQDMSLWVAEFTRKSEEVTAQVERVKGYADRVKNAAKAVAPILTVDWDVFKMREARIGVDLVADDPHKALLFEVGILEGEEQRLIVLHLRVEECLRLLRRMGYVLGKELDDRKLTVQIDHTALALDAHSSLVVAHNGGQIGGDESKGMAEAKSGRGSTRNPLLPTLENEQTWESLSWKHCAAAEKLLKDADALLVLVESTLQSSCERIQTAVCDTNAAFEARLIALRRLKCHLEEEHEQAIFENDNKIHTHFQNE
ncbi:Tektin-1 [Folsomia candida]|uniref:Tektin n=1 Tax=Folsomia candida TaxID=158441 RepID=A0A226CZI5_FOLCA|nr:Tektin-1 [Folsomia candida]